MTNMPAGTQQSVDCDKLRRRIENEDALLNSRTTIFLATNGLWIAAVGFTADKQPPGLDLVVRFLGLLVALLWKRCAWKSVSAIKELTKMYVSSCRDDAIDRAVRKAVGKPGLLNSPSDLIGRVLPSLFCVAWIVLLFLLHPQVQTLVGGSD